MKSEININNTMVAIPLIFGVFGFILDGFWIVALLLTILTGFAQLVIAIRYTIQYPHDKHIYSYFLGVLLFFSLWHTASYTYPIWVLPPLLAIYLTYILYRKLYSLSKEN